MISKDKEIAIRITDVKKKYRLGSYGGRTLQADLQSWWAKKRGKPDPNLAIGTDERLIGQEFWALNGVDLTIYRGERVGIIGSNGAGKSTLLKLLCRVTAPTEGDIEIWGRITSMLEVGTGFHGEMTGRENIFMNGAILGMQPFEIEAKLQEIIEFSEVEEFIDTPVKRYSSGMFVKLAFAVAASLRSEIMIMDEVLAVGDMAFQNKCLTKMQEAAQEEGRTILYVSHNMETIRKLCERVIVMDSGKVIYDGNVEQGIAIYMKKSLSENQVDIDLTEKYHIKPQQEYLDRVAAEVEMEHLLLTGKVMPVYQSQEAIKIRLKAHASEMVENVSFRLTLRSMTDVAVGTSWSEKFTLKKGENILNMSLSTDVIAEGTFMISIGLYEIDELGWDTTLDHITAAFKIDVEGPNTWYEAYGPIQLLPIQVQVD